MYNDTEGSGGTPPVAVVDSYVKLPHNNYTAVMNHLAQVGPLGISVYVAASRRPTAARRCPRPQTCFC